MGDLEKALESLDCAQAAYIQAHNYFEGDVPEVFERFHQYIRTALKGTAAAYRFRLARKPVTVLANRIKIASITVPDDKTATARIDDIRSANDMPGIWENEQHLRALEFGDSYLFAWDTDGLEEGEADSRVIKCGVQAIYMSPLNVRVIYDDTGRTKKYAIHRWCERSALGVEVQRADLWYADHFERWYANGSGKDVTWTPYEDEETGEFAIEENPHGQIPFFHFRTAVTYGRPEHADAYGPQDAINKLLITQLSTVDTVGFPGRYALMDPAAVLDENNDDPGWLDDEDAEQVEGTPGIGRPSGVSSSMRSSPGVIQFLNGVKQLVTTEGADPKYFTDPVDLYVRLMAMATDTPLHELDPSVDPPSGKSLVIKNAPLDSKQENRESLFTTEWRAFWIFVLKLVGIAVDDVEIEWTAPPKTADTDEMGVAKAKEEMGVPAAQNLRELGYTDDQIKVWLPGKDETDLMHRIALVGKVADAIQKLGGAVDKGLFDSAKMAGILDFMMTGAAGEHAPIEIEVPEPPAPVIMGAPKPPGAMPAKGKVATNDATNGPGNNG